MFTTVRKHRVRQGSVEELAQRVKEGFVPLVRQMRGFKGYYLLDGGPDVLITISVFDTADQALASNEKAADWVRNNVLEFTKGMPEVMVGDVLIAEVKKIAKRVHARKACRHRLNTHDIDEYARQSTTCLAPTICVRLALKLTSILIRPAVVA
jgi:heme-degrading monooxygenase HmoA